MDKIAGLLKKRGMTQTELAAAIHVANSRITMWLQHTGMPNAYQTRAIAQVLGVSMEYLTDDEATEPTSDTSGLTSDERLLLESAHRVEGGIEEALRRLFNPLWGQPSRSAPAAHPQEEWLTLLRNGDPATWNKVADVVMPKVVAAVQNQFNLGWNWFDPEQKAWSAHRQFAKDLEQGRDLKLRHFQDLEDYLTWVAKKKCLLVLQALESDPRSGRTASKHGGAVEEWFSAEAAKEVVAVVDLVTRNLADPVERIVFRGEAARLERASVAKEVEWTTGQKVRPRILDAARTNILTRLGPVLAHYEKTA